MQSKSSSIGVIVVNPTIIGYTLTVIFGIAYCFLWAFRCRNNFWLMFIPGVLALWPLTVYMYIRFFGLLYNKIRGCSVKTCEYVHYLFFYLLGAFIVIFSIACMTSISVTAQMYWGWSQVNDFIANKTYNVLNVDNCYGPVLTLTDLFGNPTNDWKQTDDYKQFSFGLISQRTMTFELNRLIKQGDQWNAELQCTTVFQANVPVNSIEYVTGVNSIGLPITSSDYTTYSNMMFLSLVMLFGLQFFLWLFFIIYSWAYPELKLRARYLLYDWPRTRHTKSSSGNSGGGDNANVEGSGVNNIGSNVANNSQCNNVNNIGMNNDINNIGTNNNVNNIGTNSSGINNNRNNTNTSGINNGNGNTRPNPVSSNVNIDVFNDDNDDGKRDTKYDSDNDTNDSANVDADTDDNIGEDADVKDRESAVVVSVTPIVASTTSAASSTVARRQSNQSGPTTTSTARSNAVNRQSGMRQAGANSRPNTQTN